MYIYSMWKAFDQGWLLILQLAHVFSPMFNFAIVTVIVLCLLELWHVVVGRGYLHHALWLSTILLWGASQTTITGNEKKDHGRWIWLPRKGMVKDFHRSKGCDCQVATGSICTLLTKPWLNISQVLLHYVAEACKQAERRVEANI